MRAEQYCARLNNSYIGSDMKHVREDIEEI